MLREHKIPQGTQSTVVRTSYNGRPVVVKKISAIEDTAAAKKIHREIEALKKAANGKHPNIIQVIDIKKTTSNVIAKLEPKYVGYKPVERPATQVQYDIIMPDLQRGSLEEHAKLFIDAALHHVAINYFKQILKGLKYLHECGFVHGSLTLSNILLDNYGIIKIIDLGDAELIEGHVTPLDDLYFQCRPKETGSLTLYNYLRSSDHDEEDETEENGENQIGLLTLFKKMFLQNSSNPKALAFYNEMQKLLEEQNTKYIDILLQHPFLRNPEFTQQLQRKYSKQGLELHAKRESLYEQLTELTPHKRLSELTTHPLLDQPPLGFHSLFIQFPLGKLTKEEISSQQQRFNSFLLQLPSLKRTFDLKKSILASTQAYRLKQYNTDPKKPIRLQFDSTKSTCFSELADDGWQVVRVYDHEHVSRAYIAIAPRKNKIIITFMGAETIPSSESWWTNQGEQASIWKNVNFFKLENAGEHTGITRYAYQILAEIDRLLKPFNLHNPICELTGHSTGGVLAFFALRHLKKQFPGSAVNAITFATPNFLTRAQCRQFAEECQNTPDYFYANLMHMDDPAFGIYGPEFHQPDHTILIGPYAGFCFKEIYAASPKDTLVNNHLPTQYQKTVEQLSLRSRL